MAEPRRRLTKSSQCRRLHWVRVAGPWNRGLIAHVMIYHPCMKAKAVFAAAISAVVFSIPAHADPESAEEFWAVVHSMYHIPISHDDAMAEGPAICLYLDQPGTNFEEAGMQVLKMHPDWTVDQAGEFAGAATGAWCPQNGPSGS